MEKILNFKKQFSKTKFIHLNNGGLSPISLAARDKIKYWADRFYEDGFYSDQDYMSDVLHARKSLAQLIGCNEGEIAFFQSTGGAISQLALEFPLTSQDEIIMWGQEYGSNLYPWQEACKRVDARLILLESTPNLSTPIEKIINVITDKTKVIAISWVQFLTGARTDIEELSKITKAKNIFLFVDIIQGLGLFECKMNEWEVDAMAGGSHKWLYSPVGVGYLALASKHHGIIKPHNFGSNTYGSCDDPTSLECIPKFDALKYEPGSKQVLEITALGASIDLILDTGVNEIRKECFRLSSYLRNGLEKLNYKVHSPYDKDNHESAFINFVPKSKTREILESIPCNFAIRGPGLRLSPAAHNTKEEIDLVLQALLADE